MAQMEKIYCGLRLEDSILSKTTVPPKANCRFSAISIKLPMAFFIELEPKNLKICMETQKTLSSQSNLEKEKQNWRNRLYKVQSQKQYGIGTKRNTDHGTGQKTHTSVVN